MPRKLWVGFDLCRPCFDTKAVSSVPKRMIDGCCQYLPNAIPSVLLNDILQKFRQLLIKIAIKNAEISVKAFLHSMIA